MRPTERMLVTEALERLGAQRVRIEHDAAGRPHLDDDARHVAALLKQALQQDEPDALPPGWNRPAPASGDELAQVLQDVLRSIEEDDSMEGFIEWSAPYPDPCDACGGSGKIRELQCPDGGKCHHQCVETTGNGQECWRVHCAEPLSASGWDRWPEGAHPTLRDDTDPCPACGGTGETWEHQEQLRGAEFGIRARYRIGTSMGQGGIRVFTKETNDAT